MTSKDNTGADDADFKAFLCREGSLAAQMQNLPQPIPSAELDAAIIAAARAELATNPGARANAMTAANDDAPPVKRTVPGFISRWRFPLGIAASLLATVQLLRMQLWQEQSTPGAPTMLLEKPPAAASPLKKIEQDKIAPFAADEKKAISIARRPVTRENWVDDEAGHRAAIIAPSPAALSRSESGAQTVTAPQASAAQAPTANFSLSARDAKPAASATEPAFATDAALAPNPAPAPLPKAKEPLNTRSGATGAPPDSAASRADAWLAAINRLLKAGLQKDALAEWVEFRKSYPDYPVPDKLSEQIKDLQNIQP